MLKASAKCVTTFYMRRCFRRRQAILCRGHSYVALFFGMVGARAVTVADL